MADRRKFVWIEFEEVFYNPNLVLGPKREKGEERYYILGSTDAGRLLFQVFVFKSPTDAPRPRVRPISARDMEPDEIEDYLTAIEEEEDAD